MYSFGYHRAEILGALVSILIIWLVTGALVFEAVQRTIKPVPVNGKGGWFVWPERHSTINAIGLNGSAATEH